MNNQAEKSIRTFLQEELQKEWAATIELTETFEIDSLDQVDLRVFLEETFSLTFKEPKPFKTLQAILEMVDKQELAKV